MPRVVFNPDLMELRGDIAGHVYTRARSGPTLRTKGMIRHSDTVAQQTSRANFSRAAILYKTLTDAQIATWAAYAEAHKVTNPLSGEHYASSPINAFMALTTKFYQVNPVGTPPHTAPASGFAGDTITVTAAGAGDEIVFTASAANATNVKTEILVQPLLSRTRTPSPKKYVSNGFTNFSASGHTFAALHGEGWYAVAIRFVNTLTGQDTAIKPLGIVEVSG